MGCFVVAEFLLTSTSCGPSAIAKPLVFNLLYNTKSTASTSAFTVTVISQLLKCTPICCSDQQVVSVRLGKVSSRSWISTFWHGVCVQHRTSTGWSTGQHHQQQTRFTRWPLHYNQGLVGRELLFYNFKYLLDLIGLLFVGVCNTLINDWFILCRQVQHSFSVQNLLTFLRKRVWKIKVNAYSS